MAIKTWDPKFGPSYTPMEMLDLGIFEGIYTAAIPNIPSKYKKHKKVLPKGSKPDITINKFKIKSRQSLQQWQKKGWTTKDSPLGWWQWYVLYFEGRRLPEEDKLQIGRWRSFVARHQGQIVKSGDLKNLNKRAKQRQGLLQWGWDSTVKFEPDTVSKNAIRIAKAARAKIDTIGNESYPPSSDW
jgi:hypothetical protein